MGWRPAEFWATTITEFFAAWDIFCEMNADPEKTDAPSDDEMDALLKRYG